MAGQSIEIDIEEAAEHVAVLEYWSRRLNQLPEHLRRRVMGLDGGEAFEVVDDGAGLTLCCRPDFRALVGSLRALRPNIDSCNGPA